jgi:hypothetical protein
VKISPEQISSRAYEILERLILEIGARPAGSAAEKHGQELVADLLKAKGYDINWMAVPFIPQPVFFPFYTLAAIGFAVSAGSLSKTAWLGLLMPILVVVLPELILSVKMRRPFTGKSNNLLALPANTNLGEIDIIFCAHMDTARATPSCGELWYQWRSEVFKTMLRVAIILAILGVMELIGFLIPPPVILAVQIITALLVVVLIVQDVWEQIGSAGKFSPGANDNGSGVAVVTALAEYYGDQKPEKLKVGYLFSGAEECGLYGAHQFAAYMQENKANALVLSVDMVGAGWTLQAITQVGTISRIKTDPELIELLERANPQIERLSYTRRSGDFEPFCHAGIKAGGIESGGTKRSWRAYHSVGDDLGVIDMEMLTQTVETLRQLIWLLEKTKN